MITIKNPDLVRYKYLVFKTTGLGGNRFSTKRATITIGEKSERVVPWKPREKHFSKERKW